VALALREIPATLETPERAAVAAQALKLEQEGGAVIT
jgi:hypothetical protein